MMYGNQFNWIVAIFVLVACCYATSYLVIKPRDTTAIEGQRVQLNCSTSDPTTPISWQYVPVAQGGVLPKDVFLGGGLIYRYQLRFEMHGNRSAGVYNLVIPSVQLKDTGTYRCRDQDGSGEHVDASLNVTENTDLRIAPEHAEAQIGSRVQLNCTTYHKTERVNWQHIPLGKTYSVNVYINGKFVNSFTAGYEATMNSTTGENSLIIKAVKSGDGGLYRCIEKEGRGQNKDAELTVIAKGSLTSWPQNTEALINQTVRLSCSTSEPYLLNWEHVRFGASRKEFVYFGGGVASPYDSRFRIISDDVIGRYDLGITAVQLEDSGRYRCIDREGQGERREAELVVFGSPPECSSENKCGVTKQDVMRVTCHVPYVGNAVPEFKCDSMTDVVTTTVERDSGNVTYVLVFRVDPQTLTDYDICRTSISNISSSRFQTNAAFARAEKRQVTITHPGHVTCSVNSSRSCEYKWVRGDRNNETVSREQKIFIDKPGLYRCEADCKMADVNCRIEPVEVNFEQESDLIEPEPRSVMIIVIVVVVLVLVCASVPALGMFLMKRHKKSKGNEETQCHDVMLSKHQLTEEAGEALHPSYFPLKV